MHTEADLVLLADLYASANGLAEATVSSRVFDDSKRLAAIRSGKGITLRRFNDALRWFSNNWPESVDWPTGVTRPPIASEAAQ
jgi:hypothetical protein